MIRILLYVLGCLLLVQMGCAVTITPCASHQDCNICEKCQEGRCEQTGEINGRSGIPGRILFHKISEIQIESLCDWTRRLRVGLNLQTKFRNCNGLFLKPSEFNREECLEDYEKYKKFAKDTLETVDEFEKCSCAMARDICSFTTHPFCEKRRRSTPLGP